MSKPKNRPFVGVNVGKGPVPMPMRSREVRPVAIYLKEDGALDDKPSFVLSMIDLASRETHGQLTLNMLNDGLDDVDYTVVKKSDLLKLLTCIHTDAQMALDDTWDRSDDGFVTQQEIIYKFLDDNNLKLNSNG